MKRLFGLFITREFLRFLMAGGTAAALNWASRFAFSQVMSFGWAVALAYMVGFFTAFTLNRMFVFDRSDRTIAREMINFGLVNAVSFPIMWVVSMLFGLLLLPHYMSRPLAEAVGNAIGIMSPVGISFALHKFFTFKKVSS